MITPLVKKVLRPHLILFAALCACSGARAASIVLTAVADTSLYQNHPDSNLGGTTLVAGKNQQGSNSRALFRFDLSAIPAGSIITDAYVALSVTRRPDPDQHTGPVDSNFSLFRSLTDWGEGTGSDVTGSVAMAGDATWLYNHFDTSSWAGAGGLVGADYANDASATTSISGLGLYTWNTTPAMIDDVQGWLDNPANNFGYFLISDDENSYGTARRFASREQPGGGTEGPQLYVTYTTAPEPGKSALLALAMTGVLLRRARRSIIW